MPARSLKAQPDAELKSEIADLKAQVSALDNANNVLSKQLGQAQKDQRALGDLKAQYELQGNALASARAENARLNADLISATAKGSSDANVVAAAKKIAEGIKALGA